jgi:NADH dehydrogenase [ubiquinone] 1 alpha subcomplex assembly factor 7
MIAAPLSETLRQRIATTGPISVADYMAACNAAYYGRGDVFGIGGDFVTAPEISQTFGELIGLWCAVTWQAMGAPYPFRLVECGPGRGTLMRDLLRATERVSGFHAAADIHLVETSPGLRTIQAHALDDHHATWHDSFAAVPNGPLIVVANEFLDALPVRQFERTPDGWGERMVGLDDSGKLIFTTQAGRAAPVPIPLAAEAAPGAVFETSEAAADWVRAISERMARHGGAALIADYGHKTQALGDTVQAVRRHSFHPVLSTPGEADLTAHVDFAAVSQAAAKAGARAFGPLEQGVWLRRLGIQVRLAQLSTGKSAAVARDIGAGVRRLIEPDAMGLLFKVIALAHPSLVSLEGFAQDEAHDQS